MTAHYSVVILSILTRLAPGTRQVNGTGRVLLDSANSADSASPAWTRAESAESKLRKKSLKNHKKTHKSHENCAFRDFFSMVKKERFFLAE